MVRSVSLNFSKQVRSSPFGPVYKIDITFEMEHYNLQAIFVYVYVIVIEVYI